MSKERCIGYKNVHGLMLDLIQDFAETYKEVSRFTYMHINTGHEKTGTVMGTLDDDLVDFLRELLKRDDDLVLFIKGDHGIRAGP